MPRDLRYSVEVLAWTHEHEWRYELLTMVEYNFQVKYKLDVLGDTGWQDYWSCQIYDDYTDPSHDYSCWARPAFPEALVVKYLDDIVGWNALHQSVVVSSLRDDLAYRSRELKTLVLNNRPNVVTDVFLDRIQIVTQAERVALL